MTYQKAGASLAGLLMALVLVQSTAAPAYAHAALLRSNPGNNETLANPPIRVTLQFTEGLERKLTKIEVFDAENARVDEDDLKFDDNDPAFASVGLPELAPGLYFVKWSNVSTVDGHPYSGRYPFIVLNEDGSLPAGVSLDNPSATSGGTEALPRPIDAALKWLAMLSLAAVAGAAFFVAMVLRPASRFLDEDDEQRVAEAGEQWVVNLAHVLLPLSFIASAFLVLVTVSRFDTSTSLWTYLTTVRAGEYRAMLLALLIVALAGTDLLFLSSGRRTRNAGIALLIGATAGALVTYSMVSHSATATGKFWSVLSDYTHLAASAVWLGALVMLPAVLRTRTLGDDESRRFLFQANVFDRFSVAAGLSVAVVLATGVFNGLAEIPEWGAFTSTTYGRVLLIKLGIVAALLPVAGLNAFILKPRLVRAIDDTYGDPANVGHPSDVGHPPPGVALAWLQRWLPRTIAVEIALVVAVFASVGVLTQTSSAKGEIAQEAAIRSASAVFRQTAETGDLKLTLEVTPNLVGRNEYTVSIKNADDTPIDTATQARLRFTFDSPTDIVPPAEFILQQVEPGVFRGEGPYFTQPGNWRTEARIRRSDGDDVSRLFVLPVLPQQRGTGAQGDAFDLPFDALTWDEVVGVLLILVGLMGVVYRRQLRPRAHGIATTAAALLLIGGGVLIFGVDGGRGATGDLQEGNPIRPTEASVSRGRMLFQQNCVTCHGVDGRGDGPTAASLNPQPTDFRLHTPLHTDPEFYAFIANGMSGTAMPAFADAFSAEDIWNLVNFLRASFTEAPTR